MDINNITHSTSGDAGELHVVKLCCGDIPFDINRSAGTEILRDRSAVIGVLDDGFRCLLL